MFHARTACLRQDTAHMCNISCRARMSEWHSVHKDGSCSFPTHEHRTCSKAICSVNKIQLIRSIHWMSCRRVAEYFMVGSKSSMISGARRCCIVFLKHKRSTSEKTIIPTKQPENSTILSIHRAQHPPQPHQLLS